MAFTTVELLVPSVQKHIYFWLHSHFLKTLEGKQNGTFERTVYHYYLQVTAPKITYKIIVGIINFPQVP